MTAAILGASVDTGVLPSIVHGALAYVAIACNVAAVKVEIGALMASSRIVTEVDRLNVLQATRLAWKRAVLQLARDNAEARAEARTVLKKAAAALAK